MPANLKEAPRSRHSYGRMTYRQFLEWDGENQHLEWVNGEVIEMAPVSNEHNDVTGFLIALLIAFVHERRLGKVRFDPFQMKAGPNLPGRAPDVMFIAKRNLRRLKRLFLDGPADLVVEVISPGTGSVDRGEKFDEYERGGVKEYWLIDPDRKQVQFNQLRDGLFRPIPVTDGVFRSVVLKGLVLKIEWLWDEDRAAPGELLKQMKAL